jgi:hypothetical protein
MDATLHQAAVERCWCEDGWSLEHFTTERRTHAEDVVDVERRHTPLKRYIRALVE